MANLTYNTFRGGAGGVVAKEILGVDLTSTETWRQYATAVIAASNKKGGKWYDRLEKRLQDAHCGEAAVALAALVAADHAAYARRLEQGRSGLSFLELMNLADEPHAEAVAACFARRD